MSHKVDFIWRFWSKVDRSGGENACWEWQGSQSKNGYGRFGKRLAHRVAHELCIGSIPEGFVVHHKCHNRSCVNPKHLEARTLKDNVRDAIERGTFHQNYHYFTDEERRKASKVRWSRRTDEYSS